MQKIANFLVEKRRLILTLFLILAAISGIFATQVTVNMDMTYYLPEDSNARMGAEIMEGEFATTGLIHVLFEGLDEDQQLVIFDGLMSIPHVDLVMFDADSEQHVNNELILYAVILDVDIFSDEAATVLNMIEALYEDYNPEIISAAAMPVDMLTIVIPAMIILLVVLFAMCHSWFEAIIILVNIGISILLNMGTNVIFSSVSDITLSIVAILQLVLSIDYSVILLDRYRYEKYKVKGDKYQAMKNTLTNSFATITSIGFTTIVGMMMLVFLSFTIGRDLGFVLAKGVFFSLLCIFTVMPALMLAFDDLISKTEKPIIPLKMKKIATFSYKARLPMAILFVVLFGAAFFTRGNLNMTYSEADHNPVHLNFNIDNPIVVVYENADEANIALLIQSWMEDEYVVDIQSYATTTGAHMTAEEFVSAFQMELADVKMLFALYTLTFEEVEVTQSMTFYDFINFIINDVATNERFESLFRTDDIAALDAMLETLEIVMSDVALSAMELALMTDMESLMIEQLFELYSMIHGEIVESMTFYDFISFILVDVATNPDVSTSLPMEELEPLGRWLYLAQSIETNAWMSALELAEIAGMEVSEVEQLFELYTLLHLEAVESITLYHFITFITADMNTTTDFSQLISEDELEILDEVADVIADGRNQLVGQYHSRKIINTNLPLEGEETFAFIASLNEILGDQLDGDFFLVGESAIAYEMSNSFPDEFNFISLLTAFAFFIVVATTFRSLSVSLLLVIVIQASVFITMASTTIMNGGIMYLALIIAQCLLKSRVIDYGIFYTANYIESREKSGVKEATIMALNNSIHTILTSGLIMIIMTAAVGIGFMGANDAIAEILLLVSLGCLIGVMLTVFILPSLTAMCDKFIYKPGKSRKMSH